METQTTTTTAEFLNSKSTYLKMNQSKVDNLEKMIALLNKRKDIITSEEAVLTDFENNERAILLLKTDYDLAKHHKNRLDIIKESNGYIEKATEIVDEMNQKWNEVIAKAKRDALQKKDIGSILDSMKDVDFDANIDVKINYFLQLKSMVYNTGKPNMKKV